MAGNKPFNMNEAVTNLGTQPAQHNQADTPSGKSPLVVFDIEIVDAGIDDKNIWLLNPGMTYRVRVTTSFNPSDGQQQITIARPITITLQSTHGALTVDTVEYTVLPDTYYQEVYEFVIHVKGEGCPKVQVLLFLLFTEAKSIKKKKASEMNVLLQGLEELSEEVQQLCQEMCIKPDTRLPDDTAILHVVASSADKLRLHGWNGRTSLLSIEIPIFSGISLANFVASRDDPKDIRWKLHEFSRCSIPDFLLWIKQLHEHHGDGFGLVIVDQTALELPWEILEIQTNMFLGIVARIIRWIPIIQFTDHQQLIIQPEHYKGEVVAYIDIDGIVHGDYEHEILLKCCNPYHSVEDLLHRLAKPLDSVALIYLACHGMFVYNDKYKTAVGSLHNPSERVLILDFAELAEHANKQTVIFINACHSARLIADKSGLYGLPELLLSRLANGYIGTIGPVGSEIAQTISEQMLDAAQTNPDGVNIAEVFRQMRIAAVQDILHNPPKTHIAWFRFLYTFMYVYYGNPLIQLTLHSHGQGVIHD